MRRFISFICFIILLGSTFGYQNTYQNTYTFNDKSCFKQPLKIHTEQVNPQCEATTEGPPYSLTYCSLESQQLITLSFDNDSTCTSSNYDISSLFYGNNCSYYDNYFHPNTEYNCTEMAPVELLEIPNTFVQVTYSNLKCAQVQEDIIDIQVFYLGINNCYDSYTDYNDYDSIYYSANNKVISQFTCRGPGCSKGCNETATYKTNQCDQNENQSIQYIYNGAPDDDNEREEEREEEREKEEEEPCLDGCPEREEEKEKEEEEPCLDGCPEREEEEEKPCLDGCPEREEKEEPCLDGCPEREEDPCLDGCPSIN